jgi:hypothetical protein
MPIPKLKCFSYAHIGAYYLDKFCSDGVSEFIMTTDFVVIEYWHIISLFEAFVTVTDMELIFIQTND